MKKSMCYVAKKDGYELHPCMWEAINTRIGDSDSTMTLIVNYVHRGKGQWSAIDNLTCLMICSESSLSKVRQKTRKLSPTVAKILKSEGIKPVLLRAEPYVTLHDSDIKDVETPS